MFFSAHDYVYLLDESDPVRWYFWSKAALRGLSRLFLDYISKQVELFFSGSGNATIVFLIGHTLNGNMDMEKEEIFGCRHRKFESLIAHAIQAVSFYSSQIKSARLAVETWTLVATRLRVMKDMRILIGKIIWEARFEENYKN